MQEKTLAQNWTATSDIELHLSLHLQQQTPHSASCILNFKWTQPSINIFQEPTTASVFATSIQQPPKPDPKPAASPSAQFPPLSAAAVDYSSFMPPAQTQALNGSIQREPWFLQSFPAILSLRQQLLPEG